MKIILSVLWLTFVTAVNAQTPSNEVQLKMADAWKYLNGIEKPLNPSKALVLYKECAIAGNAKAMNAVGMQYKLGLGTERDVTEARFWFNKAANKGYAKAWINLGLMSKYGDEPDFKKAYEYFNKAAVAKEASGFYAKGYMLYKGLGCEQDYGAAAILFKKGALKGKPSCMYFLGLCLRNGYGTAQNQDSAKYWLKKAMHNGYTMATDELAINEPENNGKVLQVDDHLEKANKRLTEKQASLKQFSKLKHQAFFAGDIEGIYEGKLIKYDWGGKKVLQCSKLHLEIKNVNNILTGTWLQDDSISIDLKAKILEGGIEFENMSFDVTDHYSPRKPEKKIIEKGSMKIMKTRDTVYLAGNIQMFSPTRKEPERPQYILLSKVVDKQAPMAVKTDGGSKDHAASIPLTVYPNPFQNSFNIDFYLENATEVQAQIFSVDGKTLYSKVVKLSKGRHHIPINIKLPKGSYIVTLNYGNKVQSTTIVKQ